MARPILVVDDDQAVRTAISRWLTAHGFDPIGVNDGDEAMRALGERDVDLVLLDMNLPGRDGLNILSDIRQTMPQLPVVMMSGGRTIDRAMQAIRLGAVDFIDKPLSLERLQVSMDNGLRLSRMALAQEESLRTADPEHTLVGSSAVLGELRELIRRIAPTEGRVLITGENGTGKEAVADAIVALSARRSAPYIKLNCAAIPAELVESELFGHERGAFTGATALRRGKFELADGGTLFLDEVGDMPKAVQPKVLRVLQSGTFERVGGARSLTVDVRVLAATNRPIEAMVKSGEFREDLFFRLNVVRLVTPPLRARSGDIPLLLERFLETASKRHHRPHLSLTSEAMRRIAAHEFPGNVRELQNLAERLAIFSSGGSVSEDDVARLLGADAAASAGPSVRYQTGRTLAELLDDAERQIIREALQTYDSRVSETAKALDVDRSHFYRKAKRLGIVLAKS